MVTVIKLKQTEAVQSEVESVVDKRQRRSKPLSVNGCLYLCVRERVVRRKVDLAGTFRQCSAT